MKYNMRNILFYNHFDNEEVTHEVFMRVDDDLKSLGKFDSLFEMFDSLSKIIDEALDKINYHPMYDTVITNIFHTK